MLSLPEVYNFLSHNGFFDGKVERPLINYALNSLERVSKEGGVLLLQLPTGYGKTAMTFSSSIRAIIQPDYFWRVIHVSPLRSIINDIYYRAIKGFKRILSYDELTIKKLIAPQMMFFSGSPYLQRKFVITTFDTLSLSIAKIPISEMSSIVEGKGYGHFDIPRASILESLVIMDEIHSFLSEANETKALQVLISIMEYLAESKTPLLLMSATIPKVHAENLLNRIGDLSSAYCERIYYGENGLIDKDFENEQKNKNLKAELMKGTCEDIANKCLEFSSSYNKILIVLNTIPRALKVYNELIKRGLKPILLHSKFKEKDKEDRIRAIKGNEWILVSTQVIEAGVDLSANVLITDIAPANNLIQRIGRVARKPSDTEGIIIILGDPKEMEHGYHIYDSELVNITMEELFKYFDGNYVRVSWRSLGDNTHIGYQKFIDNVYSKKSWKFIDDSVYNRFISYFKWTTKDIIISLMDFYNGSFIRDSPLIPLILSSEHLDLTEESFDLIKLRDHMIAIDLNDVKQMIKKGIKIKKITKEGKSEELKIDSLVKEIITERTIALCAPEQIYNEKEGLMLSANGIP